MATGDFLTSTPDAADWDPLPVPPSTRMTEEEFEAWCKVNEEVRAEWVDGEVVLMSPGSYEHEDLDGWLVSAMRGLVEVRKLGTVLGSNSTVRLATQRRRRLPDALFVAAARRQMIRRTYIDGAPDAAFEIVSDDSEVRDRQEKFAEYERAGVREYWILDPNQHTIEVFALGTEGRYAKIEPRDGKLNSRVIDGFYLRPEWMNEETRPTIVDTLREWGCL